MNAFSQTTATETTETPTTRVPWRGGWAAMPHTATRSDMPNNAYRVLGLLIGHMDLTTCEVHGQSAQRLAVELGWSTRTVERGLAALRKAGWVSAYPDPAPYRLGWLVYVVRQEEVAPTELTVGIRQECREGSDRIDGGVPTVLSVHDQESDSDSDQKESPTRAGDGLVLPEMTVISPSERSERRRERRHTDSFVGMAPSIMSEPPAIVVPTDVPTALTETEQLLLEMGFHPTTAHAFRDFDVEAVRAELHRQDLLGWQPQEERNRRIGRLVLRWRKVRPEVLREREVGGSYQEPAVSHAVQCESDDRFAQERAAPHTPRSEDEVVQAAHSDVQLDQGVPSEDDSLSDPWIERARRLRPAWTSEQQAALARAFRHAPNDGAAVAMAQVMLGVARRC